MGLSVGLSLISAILINQSTVTLRELDRDLIVGEEETRAFDYVVDHFRRYAELPVEDTVEEHARVTLPTADEAVGYYINQMVDRNVYLQAREIFPQLRDAISTSNTQGVLDAADSLRTACRLHTGQQQELLTGTEVGAQVLETYRRNANVTGLVGITTGYAHLDRETGGYQNGDLVTFVGRPEAAKTFSLIHQMSAACRAGHSALFVSNEMTIQQIGSRLASMMADLDPDHVRKGQLSHFGVRRLEEATARIGEFRGLNLFSGNLGKSVSEVDILIQELNPDIVYIDGMYLMKPSNLNQRMGRYERVAYLVDELKQQTLIHNRPIIITSQFGRAANKNGQDGSLENIGYTDTIGTHSSLVISIQKGRESREEIVEIAEDGERRVMGYRPRCHSRIFELLKGREGESGRWACNFRFSPTNFEEIPVGQAEESTPPTDVSNMM